MQARENPKLRARRFLEMLLLREKFAAFTAFRNCPEGTTESSVSDESLTLLSSVPDGTINPSYVQFKRLISSLSQLMKRLLARVDRAAGCQLAAGGVDVAPARATYEGMDAFGFEDQLKAQDPFGRRRTVRKRVGWIVRDE